VSTALSVDTTIEVKQGFETIGFVERVGPVFVSLLGSRYDRAVEIAQKLDFDDAYAAVLAGLENTRAPMVESRVDEITPRRNFVRDTSINARVA
jgi:hypothetical protein